MTKDEALRMAIEWLDNQQLGYSGHSVRKACQDALAQPTAEQSSLVQEPVAWKDKIYGNLHHADYGDSIPLYTTPSREWQGLSGEEFVAIAKSIWGDNLGMSDGFGYTVAWASSYATIEPSSKMLLLYHAIDKALREKNELF